MLKHGWVLFPAAFALGGCGNDDLPKYYKLDRLRVLAMVVSTPEVAAGTAGITVTPFVSDPQGGGRTLAITAEACVDPGVGYGATPSCSGNPTRVTSGTISVGAGTFVPGSSPGWTGNAPVITVDVPSAAVMFLDPVTGAARSAVEQYNGVPYLVLMTITSPNGEQAKSFKRIVVSTRPGKNSANPVLTGVTVGGVDSAVPPSRPTSETTLATQVSALEKESYSVMQSNGAVIAERETLTVSWFISSGDLDSSHTDPGETNRYTPAGSGAVFFGVILHDSRGGTAISSFTL